MRRPVLERTEKPVAVAALALVAAGVVAALYSAAIHSGEPFVSVVSLIVSGCFLYCSFFLVFLIRSMRRK